MSEENAFETFVDWVNVISDAEGFEGSERTYKLELASEFQRRRSDGLSPDAILGWLRDKSNNIVGWRTKDILAKGPTDALATETEALLADGDLGPRLDRFASWFEREFDARPGEQMTLASSLLMGSDPKPYPP